MLGVIEATHPFIRPMFRPLCLFASLWKRSVCAWSTHATSQSQPTSCEVREAQTRVLDGNILRPRSEAHTPKCWTDESFEMTNPIWDIWRQSSKAVIMLRDVRGQSWYAEEIWTEAKIFYISRWTFGKRCVQTWFLEWKYAWVICVGCRWFDASWKL